LLLFGVAMVALRHFRFFTPHSDLLFQLPYTETLDVILRQKKNNYLLLKHSEDGCI
jgi:hypothetical protein